MPEPLESEPAGVKLESDALPQEVPPGDLRRHPEAPGNLYLGQAAAVPISGQPQVASEAPPFNEYETTDDDEAPQLPASGGFRAAPTVTTGGVAAVLIQHNNLSLRCEMGVIHNNFPVYVFKPVAAPSQTFIYYRP
jgi:hypothetical protein